MNQSRLLSMIEAVANVVVGMVLSLVTQMVVFPMYGMKLSLGDNVGIMAIFTVVSLVRSYALRRVFNHRRFHEI